MPLKFLSRLLISLLIISFTQLLAEQSNDENSWLENIDSEKSLNWVKKANLKTDGSLAESPLYESLYQDALTVLNNKHKLPRITQRGEWIYNYWKDSAHPRGVYRRAKIDSFNSGKPSWQTVLDIDKMSKDDSIKWVFKGMSCLKPDNVKCLVNLSPGGSDASEVREFNTQSLTFIKDGFNLPSAKTNTSWIDENTIFVGTDFGKGSLTDSGYSRIQKIWKRGTAISDAKTVIEVNKKSVSARARHFDMDSGDIDILDEGLTFWTNKYSQYINGELLPLNLPESARIIDAVDGRLVISLKDDWSLIGQNYKQGSVLLVEPSLLRGEKGAITLLVEDSNKAIIEDVTVTAKGILVITLEDAKSRIYLYENKSLDNDAMNWVATQIDLPRMGNISIETVNSETGEFFARYEDFLTAPTLYSINSKLEAKVAIQQAATFDGTNFMVEQYFATSQDGTKVPYFVVMNKNIKYNSTNPTHIFSYGGFRNSLTPSYSGSYEDLNGAYGKMWLERGGVFVLANIRGGGEYGPAWHAAALLENRHKSFEDFEAIAEDLISKKITSAKHLGIEGRSNGGLLVGATMTRRPDLYGAVICGVPLLDMKRYHKLLAGASWMAEYGDPDTSDWEFMKTYSPYQNIKNDVQYPPIFFFTSTRDDRVHPGHARKMAARLMSKGNAVEFYENLEGGHKGSSTSEQLAKRIALGYAHLWKQLGH
jgi:prolyl oligopeptidase